MQRGSAIMLLVLFSILLISPMLTADDDSALPACCRKGGQHHCSMENMEQPDEVSGLGLKSNGTKCPLFPQDGAAPACGSYIAPTAARFFAGIVSHPTAHAQIEAQYRVSFSRAGQKRGPPALLS